MATAVLTIVVLIGGALAIAGLLWIGLAKSFSELDGSKPHHGPPEAQRGGILRLMVDHHAMVRHHKRHGAPRFPREARKRWGKVEHQSERLAPPPCVWGNATSTATTAAATSTPRRWRHRWRWMAQLGRATRTSLRACLEASKIPSISGPNLHVPLWGCLVVSSCPICERCSTVALQRDVESPWHGA